LNDSGEDECPDRDAHFLVHESEEFSPWNSIVPRECPGTSGGSDCDADGAEHGYAEDEEGESEAAAWGPHYEVEDVGEGLAAG